ncbi:MAG: hypothetical protein HY074_15520 [Deltaproteobacteria bacterium]|nr:hypothetical protein [Deltaproteobacteria bacterium]
MPIQQGMTVREKLFFGTFSILVVLAIATAAAAIAASNGSLTLIGFVPELHSLTIVDTDALNGRSPAAELAAANEDIELARIIEVNNAPGVFQVTIGSKNSGLLKGAGETGPAYALTYNTSSVDLANGPRTVEAGFRAGGTRTVHVLKIHLVTKTPDQLAKIARGTYTDTITFSVAAD